ncbi:MAG: permease, partial [Cyanobacteria bacterium P01_G01_bin.49]
TAIQVFLPQAQLLGWGKTPTTQILVMLILSLVVSLNSVWSPYFLSPLTSTLLSGSSLIFLLFSSLFSLPSLALLLTTIQKKAALYIIILTTQLILILGFALNFYFA